MARGERNPGGDGSSVYADLRADGEYDAPEPDEAAVEALAGDDVIRLGQVIGCEWISEWDERDDSTFTMCDRHNEVWPCVPGKILAHGYVAPDRQGLRMAAEIIRAQIEHSHA